MTQPRNELDLEKLKIHERLVLIEQYILEGKEQRLNINETMKIINIRCTNLEFMVHGEPNHENRLVRDGIHRRIEFLEGRDQKEEKDSKETKGYFLKIALGAITLAVGSCVLWIGKLIWSALGK